MSKKNNALSEENLGQVSGGDVILADGTKLTGTHADRYVDMLIGSQGGGGSTQGDNNTGNSQGRSNATGQNL